MKSGHMCFTNVKKSFRILVCFWVLSNWTKYRFNSRLVSGGRFSTCNFFIIFFISSISDSYGTKTFFNVDNCLNQGIKQKVVGPLFKKRNSTCARFTFLGSDLVPLLPPEGGQNFFATQPVIVPPHNLWLIPACDIFVTCVCIYATYQIVRLRHYAPIISYNSSWHTIPSMREMWRVSATTYDWLV